MPVPSGSPAAGYSHTFRYRQASQTKERVWVSGSPEPWNKHLEQYLCWGQQLVPCYCFLITHSPAGTECLPSPPLQTVAHKVIKPLPQESVCLVNQPARPKQTVSTPPLKCPGCPSVTGPRNEGRLSASAHPSPSPLRTGGPGRSLSNLTKSKWRRKKGG